VKKLTFLLAALILFFPIIGGCAEKKEYDLTIAVYGNGTTVPIPGTYTHDEGEAVTITAIPDSDWALDHWSGDATGTAATVTITVDSAKEVNADFAQVAYRLTVKVIPTRGGLVSLKPPQPWEGYVVGTEVTLTAVAHAGYEFHHWGGDATGIGATATITMDSDKEVYAHFNQIGYRLTVEVTPIGGGAVTVEPSQPPEGYVAGTEVTLTAVASEGYQFHHWGGDATGIAATVTITMDPDKKVYATFDQIRKTLTVEVVPTGRGAVTVEPAQPAKGYVAGTEVTLTAVASEGYEFDHWDVCGIAYFGSICGESRENPITITWGLEPGKAVTAFFSQ